jgi:putative membrane protein
MMNGYGMMDSIGFGFGWIFMILWWIIVIVGIVVLMRWLGSSAFGAGWPISGSRQPLDILKERYARGEINDEEFHKIKRELTQ